MVGLGYVAPSVNTVGNSGLTAGGSSRTHRGSLENVCTAGNATATAIQPSARIFRTFAYSVADNNEPAGG